MINHKIGQIWIETALYTLIGFVLLGLVLTFITPRFNQERDKAIIEQTINSLNLIDEKINEVADSSLSNRRIVEFSLRKGEVVFDPSLDVITFILKGIKKPYSEPGVEINFGRVKVLTIENNYDVIITLEYKSSVDLIIEGEFEEKRLSPASRPYSISIENKGRSNSGLTIIDISILSQR